MVNSIYPNKYALVDSWTRESGIMHKLVNIEVPYRNRKFWYLVFAILIFGMIFGVIFEKKIGIRYDIWYFKMKYRNIDTVPKYILYCTIHILLIIT